MKKRTKKGFSLVELVVAMGIFLTVITLAVAAFVAVSRMKSLTSTMKEVQQKTRISSEMITRLARQADKVMIVDGGKGVELYFVINDITKGYAYKFAINSGNGSLEYTECPPGKIISSAAGISCLWAQYPTTSLLGDTVKLDSLGSSFGKTGQIPPNLEVNLRGQILNLNNQYFSDEFTLNTKVILEGIK